MKFHPQPGSILTILRGPLDHEDTIAFLGDERAISNGLEGKILLRGSLGRMAEKKDQEAATHGQGLELANDASDLYAGVLHPRQID